MLNLHTPSLVAYVPFSADALAVTPERMRFWAAFLAQATTEEDVCQVSDVVNALWWQLHGSRAFQTACMPQVPACFTVGSWQQQHFQFWLGSCVESLTHAVGCWATALQHMTEAASGNAPVESSWYQEASVQHDSLVALLTLLCAGISAFCMATGLPLPDGVQVQMASSTADTADEAVED